MIKAILLFIALFATCRLSFGGYGYSVHAIDSSHVPIYATSDFQIANIRIQDSLLRDDLALRVEVFVISAGPGYKVLIGKIEPKGTVSDKETEYILSEVRRLLIEAKQERDAKAFEQKMANKPAQTTVGSSAPFRV